MTAKLLDVAGYQCPGFRQSLPGNGMPTDQPLTMSWSQPDWRPKLELAKALHVDGILARASNAETVDPTYKAIAEAAAAVGLPFSGYAYLRNDRIDAAPAVEVFVRALEEAPPFTLAPMADVENFTGQENWSQRRKADYILRWLTACESELGVRPIVYGPAWWFDQHIGQELAVEFAGYDFMLSHYIHGSQVAPHDANDWLAWAQSTQDGDPGIEWGRAPKGIARRAGWQFSSTGVGPAYGFASSWIDCNVVTDEAFARWQVVGPVEPPPFPEPPAPPTPEVTLYPYGYGTQMVGIDKVLAEATAHHHPEFVRRLRAWLIYKKGEFGIGDAWRATGTQPDLPGFAAEGKSFHQNQKFASGFIGGCAVDLVVRVPGKGHSSGAVPWSKVPAQGSREAERWGLHCNIGSESWHMQPIEIDGWGAWVDKGRHGLRADYPIPGTPTPTEPEAKTVNVTAAMPLLDTQPRAVELSGWPVLLLQGALNFFRIQRGEPTIVSHGRYDMATMGAVMDFQKAKRLTPDGIVGAKTWESIFTGKVW